MNKISRSHRIPLPLPCPFCGSMNVYHKDQYYGDYSNVRCEDCGALGPDVRTKRNSDEHKIEAMKEWNTRYSHNETR